MSGNYGKYIQRFRRSADLSQKELAKKLDVTEGCVSSWEVGRTEPNMGMVCKMADIFGCTISELMGKDNSWAGTPVAESVKYQIDYSIDEQMMIETYKELNAEQRKRVLQYAIRLSTGKE